MAAAEIKDPLLDPLMQLSLPAKIGPCQVDYCLGSKSSCHSAVSQAPSELIVRCRGISDGPIDSLTLDQLSADLAAGMPSQYDNHDGKFQKLSGL